MTKTLQKANIRISCDGCSQRAMYYICFSFGEIYLCRHHWNKGAEKATSLTGYISASHLFEGALK